MYDWANSAFWTTVVTAVFPIYFLKLAGSLEGSRARERFSQATTLALVVSALIAPVLGTLADFRALKKAMLAAFALLAIMGTAALYFALPGDWEYALWCFGLANVGAAASIAFYDALLPHVAREGEMDRLSASGYALRLPRRGPVPPARPRLDRVPRRLRPPRGRGPHERASDAAGAARVPLGRRVVVRLHAAAALPREGAAAPASRPTRCRARPCSKVSFQRLGETLRELRRYRQAFLMLLAFLIYNDGIATVIRMAALYAADRRAPDGVVIATVVLVQFVGIPCSFLFGGLSARFGAKRLILAGLAVYCVISALAYAMTTATHFVLLGVLVALVQGGTQALSRSLFASLTPRHKTGEFFSFFGIGEKFAGIFGPLLYGLVIRWTGSAPERDPLGAPVLTWSAGSCCCRWTSRRRQARGAGGGGGSPAG